MLCGNCASLSPPAVNLASEEEGGILSFLSNSPCLFKDNIISLDAPSYLPFRGKFGIDISLLVSYNFIREFIGCWVGLVSSLSRLRGPVVSPRALLANFGEAMLVRPLLFSSNGIVRFFCNSS